MMDSTDRQLQRLFAEDAAAGADEPFVAAVMERVQREQRAARRSMLLGVGSLLLAAAVVSPLIGTWIIAASSLLQGLFAQSAQMPLATLAVAALLSLGTAVWATRS